jgi:GT2 family glycosyltransferase/glycosyltransferase involved in cell wall biosynthesis
MPTTEIILPVHNGLSLLRDCVDAVLAYTPRGVSQLHIVDDASDPVTATWLREQAAAHPGWITLRRQDQNRGFLATCNRALANPLSPLTPNPSPPRGEGSEDKTPSSRVEEVWGGGAVQQPSDYLVLLNSDVLVTPGWLERLLACAETDPRIVAVNPLTNRADNIDLPMAPGISYLAMNDFLAAERRGQYHDVVTGVGFCLLLRRRVLDQVGLFDPAYEHGYCEESDLCMRLIAAGFRTVVAEDVYVYHRGGGSFRDGQERYLRNRRLFDQRWGKEYRRQFRAFRRADPLQSTRQLLALPTRWDPQPALWQAAREGLAEWRGARSPSQMARITVRQALTVLTNRRLCPRRSLTQTLTPPGRLRVTYVLDRLVVAGGVLSVLQLVNELIRLGVEARVAALYEDPLIHDWRPLYTQPLIYRNVTELLAECPDSDVIFATHWNTVDWVHRLWQAGRTRVAAYLIQDYEPWFFPETAADQRERVRMTYRCLPHRIVMSDWLGERLADDGYSSAKIPLGMDLGQFYPRPIQVHARPVVLAMARPGTPRRGFPATIAALAQIKQTRPEIDIVLFGDRFLDRQAIPFPFRDEGLVIRQERLAELYSEADIFLDGSEFQGFGRCALEAMACGAACVLTDLGGVMEYARHEDNALLTPPGQAEAMAAAMLRLLDDSALRRQLIASGLDTAARFCQRREAHNTLAWIKQILAAETPA